MTTPPLFNQSAGRSPSFFDRKRLFPPDLERLNSGKEPLIGLSLLLCALVFWFVTRYYAGTRHDSMLYLAQAMHRAWPENFGNDIFFAYGSQDQFSVYSLMYSWLAGIFGWADLMPVLLMTCQIGFILALVLLLRELIPLPFIALGLVIAATVPYYGGYLIFSFGEPFLTARSIAEPLVLFAVWCVVRGRLLASIPFLIGALVFHPLMTVVGIGVLYVWLADDDRRWLWLLLLAPIALVLAALNIAGFDVLLRSYDDEWWETLTHNAFVFPAVWRGQDWAKVVFDGVVLFLASRLMTGVRAKLIQSVLLVCAMTLMLSTVGADVFRLQLITQAQLWRSQWLGHALACCVFPWVVWQLRNRGTLFWLGAVLTLAALIFRQVGSSVYAAITGALAMLYAWRQVWPSTRWFDGFVIVVIVAVLNIGLINELSIVAYRHTIGLESDPFHTLRSVFEYTAASSFLMLGCVMLALRMPRVLMAGAVLALVFTGLSWDQRSNWNRYVEAGLTTEHPFARQIPKSAQVYWAGELVPAWFMLKRPSYYTANQASGLLFNRETALEYLRRQNIVKPLDIQVDICKRIESLIGNCSPGMRELRGVCSAKGGPDFVILAWDVDAAYIDRWRGQFTNETPHDQFLYSCSALNQRPIAPNETN